jgi:8-oxo-dGTP pyrophosphatase MutT (NUDIX family)
LNRRLPEELAALLRRPLPGWRAQRALQPELSYGRHFGPPPASARPAAVLALVYPHRQAWCLALTLRTDTLPDHAGQISLPGGAISPGESDERAALRELEEELGPSTDSITMLGQLSPLYLFNSGFRVSSWLAFAAERPAWRPNPLEVVALLEVPLARPISSSANIGALAFAFAAQDMLGRDITFGVLPRSS